MLTTIAIAEAIAATAAAIVAIYSRQTWRERAEQHLRAASNFRRLAIKQTNRARNLDAECAGLAVSLVRLSRQIDTNRSKPGPAKRAAERALIQRRAAELRGEVSA